MPTTPKLLAQIPLEKDLSLQIIQHPHAIDVEFIEFRLRDVAQNKTVETLRLDKRHLQRFAEELHVILPTLGVGGVLAVPGPGQGSLGV